MDWISLVVGLLLGGVVVYFAGRAHRQKSVYLERQVEELKATMQQRNAVNETEAQRTREIERERGDLQTELAVAKAQIAESEGWKAEAEALQERQREEAKRLAASDEKVQALLRDQDRLQTELGGLQELRDEKVEWTALNRQLKTQLDEQAEQSREKLALLEEAKTNLKNEFQVLAQKIFDEKSKKFTEKNQEKLDALISPFKEQLKDFAKKVDETYDKESKERVSLKEQILQLQRLNAQMSTDAVNLTKALKGDVKTMGTWGELILERILEESGLREGIEYLRQASYQNEEGKRAQPDVVVKLPEGKEVIVDSKVSLVAYERYCSAETEEERDAALGEHVLSIRNHMKGLSAKAYDDLDGVNSLEYVLMFLPVEGAFRLALDRDKELYLSGVKKNVLLVSPSTLLITLRTIHSLWNYEYQNRHARDIADRAGSLYDKFVGFVADLEKIGKSLEGAQKSYADARKKLVDGRGNLVRQTEQLRELGIKHKKHLPAEWVEESEDRLVLVDEAGS